MKGVYKLVLFYSGKTEKFCFSSIWWNFHRLKDLFFYFDNFKTIQSVNCNPEIASNKILNSRVEKFIIPNCTVKDVFSLKKIKTMRCVYHIAALWG